MKPKEKAKGLVGSFQRKHYGISGYTLELSKQSALICVGEVIKSHDKGLGTPMYWNEVKQEIEKL